MTIGIISETDPRCSVLKENKTLYYTSNIHHMNSTNIRRKQDLSRNTKKIISNQRKFYKIMHPIIVAIDPGHGGQDPGAIGPNGLHEKNVTMAISRKLKMFLDADPMFKPFLTRDGDYFISVMERSNIARQKGAEVLISIHADATLNRNAHGASVWVLSNQRAHSEMKNWLRQHHNKLEILGGVGNLIADQIDPDLIRTVLDLQFCHVQWVGYQIAVKVLLHLKNLIFLHKCHPQQANFGVLRAPDIPSLLVETGFISNNHEETLLCSSLYQEKIAHALHLGLRDYFVINYFQHPHSKSIHSSLP